MPTWSRVTLLVTVATVLLAGCGVSIPTDPEGTLEPSVTQLEEARRRCAELDWKLHDVVIIPVPELPVPIGQG